MTYVIYPCIPFIINNIRSCISLHIWVYLSICIRVKAIKIGVRSKQRATFESFINPMDKFGLNLVITTGFPYNFL